MAKYKITWYDSKDYKTIGTCTNKREAKRTLARLIKVYEHLDDFSKVFWVNSNFMHFVAQRPQMIIEGKIYQQEQIDVWAEKL